MTPNQLRSRLKLIEGTELKDRASLREFSRRGTNTSIAIEEDNYSDTFDTFFDYEEDLAGMKSASEQYIEMEQASDPFIVMDDSEPMEEPVEASGFIEMESVPDVVAEKGSYMDVKGFEFVKCQYIKNNDEQCKRQAPKGGEYCSAHRKKI